MVSQLKLLQAHLLPRAFEPTGLYDDAHKVSTRALAYRVLAHAELEAYFEDRVIEIASKARLAWDHGSVSRVALCLLAFSGKDMGPPPATLEAPNENKRKLWPQLVDVHERFVPAVSSFHHFVRNENHGIKEKNLMALLLPIGLDPKKLDPSFLADIESFGALRGTAAHSSNNKTATQGVDPEQELKRVDALLDGVLALDVEMDAIAAAIP